jgi:hypothetical protein
MRPVYSAAVAAFLFAVSGSAAAKPGKQLSVAEVKQRIIQESIDNYPGNCPCPYNYASNGSHCGRRSAYSRGGGYSPICFAVDVTPEMVAEWRAKH